MKARKRGLRRRPLNLVLVKQSQNTSATSQADVYVSK